jgi:hypothetical protein
MKWIDYKEELQALHEAGFTTYQIERLCFLRRTYGENALDQAPLDLSRLEFIRWLIAHGRLSDYPREKS